MKKILCIVGGMNAGGAETFLMKIFRKIDKTKYQMDFCVGVSSECFYDNEILKNGGKIFHITKKSKNPIKSFLDIKRVVKNGKYKNVIRISQHSLSSLDLLAAKFGGANNLIFRSSNSNTCGSKINQAFHNIFKPLARIIPNVKIAPSEIAAIHMFGERQYKNGKVIILKNGLPLDNYKFNENIRTKKRNELKIEKDTFVIGNVGRFITQKNHKFLLNVFKDFLKINRNSKLMLIGDGELKNELLDYIEKLEIVEQVLILGVRNDVNELYQAMDCFVFPSFYEGMPNVVIEAQTSGLNCVVSDRITKDVNLSNKVFFCSLDSSKNWITKIKKSTDRDDSYKIIKEKGYDIENVINTFVKILK